MIPARKARKAVLVTGLFMCGLSDGFIFGQMSGMLAALRAEGSEIPLTDDDVSWIGSLMYVTAICGFAVYAILSDTFGRRKITITMSVPVLISWIVVFFAQDKFALLLSRITLGSFGGVMCLTYIAPAEYMPPNMRSFYTNLFSCLASSLGTSLGHILSLVLHWRNVALIGIIPTSLSTILPYFWVESPYWLALRGRFEECEIAFWKLHEHCETAEDELRLLMSTMAKKNSETTNPHRASFLTAVINIINSFKRTSVKKSMLLGTFIIIYRTAAGRALFQTLIITMLQHLTGTSDILSFTFVVDAFAVIGSALSCVLVTRCKIRPLLFTSGIIANVIFIVLAVVLYFFPTNSSYVWLKVVLLAVYFILINTGLYPVLDTILGEIFPLDVKSYCFVLTRTGSGLFIFLSTRFALSMFATMGYHGVFLLNAAIVAICLGYIWFFLPETKGRSLQEIELYFKNGEFRNINDLVEDRNKLVDVST